MIAAVLPRRLMLPCSRQARMWGPKRGSATSRASSAGLLRAKQKAASSMNGTVGSKGRKMPIAPSATAVKPIRR
jgi:hypothetical protein